jgi:O-antigen/teichoic acid export membrane protein
LSRNNLEVENSFSIKRIFGGASIYSIGEVLTKASGFFLLPIYTRILTPYEYGIVGYLQVFLQLATILLAFGFQGAQTRFFYENRTDKGALGEFMFTINITSMIIGVVIFLPVSILGKIQGWTIGAQGIPMHPYMTVTFATILISIVRNNISGYYRMRQEYIKASILQVLTFFLTAGMTIFLVMTFEDGAYGKILGNLVGYLGVVLIFIVFYARNFVFKFSKASLSYAIGFGGPIVIHLLLSTIHNSIDRIMLEGYLSLESLGIYTIALSVSSAMQMFVTSFNQAYQPTYYQIMSSSTANAHITVVKTFKIWLLLITTITIGGIFLGGPFLTVFAGEKFAESSKILPFLLVSVYVGSFYYFFSSAIFYFKKTKLLPIITGSSAIINISLNFLLIPKLGMVGAAVATIISHGWISIFSFYWGNKLFHIKWPFRFILVSLTLVFVSLAMRIVPIF